MKLLERLGQEGDMKLLDFIRIFPTFLREINKKWGKVAIESSLKTPAISQAKKMVESRIRR